MKNSKIAIYHDIRGFFCIKKFEFFFGDCEFVIFKTAEPVLHQTSFLDLSSIFRNRYTLIHYPHIINEWEWIWGHNLNFYPFSQWIHFCSKNLFNLSIIWISEIYTRWHLHCVNCYNFQIIQHTCTQSTLYVLCFIL